jgi:gamma-glutamyl:cysteine ligase YbdK (ATP-grasp superfamily)
LLKRGIDTYKTLEVLGPEHEYSIVDSDLKAMPIVDKIMRDFHGRVVNFVELPAFTFSKELQLHVMEIKPNEPFRSPVVFEETMQQAVTTMNDFLQRKYEASLLGTGMHPLLRLGETGIWPHRHRQIYEAYSGVFNLRRHGWLNIQSFQLNLPYANEREGVLLLNLLANLCAYLPAVAASSPIYEGKFGEDADNRLRFYKENQQEVPSVTGDVVPEYVSSFGEYEENVIDRYSKDLADRGADALLLGQEWVNSRGVIFRFDRKALEIRVMDEQECVKSDVALSCLVRAALRGLMAQNAELASHRSLVQAYGSVVKEGLRAKVKHPHGTTAREVCLWLLKVASDNATEEEAKYLPIVVKRIERGNLSALIRERVRARAQKTDFEEAVVSVYWQLVKSLIDNEPYF